MLALVATGIVVALAGLAPSGDHDSVSLPEAKPVPTEPPLAQCRSQVLPRAPAGLPAPVELWTRCGVYVVGTDGVVSTSPGRGKWVMHGTARLHMLLPTPRKRPRRIGVDSGLVRDPTGKLEALTATEGYTGLKAQGFEVVYVVEDGKRLSAVLRRPLVFTLCGRGVYLSWHGSWLLYGAGEGHAVAVDTATRRRIDLTSTLRRLPGTKPSSGNYRLGSAYWA